MYNRIIRKQSDFELNPTDLPTYLETTQPDFEISKRIIHDNSSMEPKSQTLHSLDFNIDDNISVTSEEISYIFDNSFEGSSLVLSNNLINTLEYTIWKRSNANNISSKRIIRQENPIISNIAQESNFNRFLDYVKEENIALNHNELSVLFSNDTTIVSKSLVKKLDEVIALKAKLLDLKSKFAYQEIEKYIVDISKLDTNDSIIVKIYLQTSAYTNYIICPFFAKAESDSIYPFIPICFFKRILSYLDDMYVSYLVDKNVFIDFGAWAIDNGFKLEYTSSSRSATLKK